jgi:RNA polymerase sigma-70 factor (ECF subfamily)
LEDKLLIWQLNRGSEDALCRIYEKYRDNLVRIAAGLLNDADAAQDIVQEVFLVLVHSAGSFEIRKNLKGYLTSCVVNKARDFSRTKRLKNPVSLDCIEPAVSNSKSPDQCAICEEEFQHLYKALTELPYEQKEAVILRVQGKMKFREIARLQEISTKTALSRYSYGLNKLRSILDTDEHRIF